jgi:DNA-binding transcriptional LysR family regulator
VPQEPPLLEEWLTAQRHDLGLTEGDGTPPGTRQVDLFSFDEVCVLPAGHPLLGRDVLRPADFDGESFISQAPSDPVRLELDEVFRRHGVERVLAMEAHDSFTICCLVREGLGVAIVNPFTAQYFGGDGVVLRPFSVPVPYRVNVVRPEFRPFTPLVEPFIQGIRDEVAAMRSRLPTRT